jgi:acetyl-CoA acetyltransferase
MTRKAASQVHEASGVAPADIKVVELHDCFAQNELIYYEALQLCGEGEWERFVVSSDNTYGGAFVVNLSNGLLSKGHPHGAPGLAQCAELTVQLGEQAGPRQVEDARLALQHNLGLGGACVVTLFERAG